MPRLSSARYGKDNIRLCKVIREEKSGWQTVVEMTVCILLEGDIETSYTKADNSVVVATDTQKQTCYILAKQNPVTPPELFATIIGNHFVETYKHIHAVHVDVITHRWTRISVAGEPHPHSFLRDGEETRTVKAVTRRSQGTSITSGIKGLLVLKSTGSAFYGFHRDEFTRLPETWDRILSTEIECEWEWKVFASLEDVRSASAGFDEAWSSAREITLQTFAKDDSASVQNTMYKMCEGILAAVPSVDAASYSLPNKHYFEIGTLTSDSLFISCSWYLSWHKGLKNTGKDAEVYAPQSDPNGLIQCTVTRDK